jgi:hypothetical protein
MIGPKRQKLSLADERRAYEAVTERDQGRCVRCGAAGPVERDHRQNRDPFNTIVCNLQLLGGPFGCGCHLWKTEHPAAAMLEGFSVPRWGRPEVWPAWRHDVGGWVLYLDEPDADGNWWQTIHQSTADLLMRGGD